MGNLPKSILELCNCYLLQIAPDQGANKKYTDGGYESAKLIVSPVKTSS